tara:strand:+ start:675 stop:1298 length:624 start_codon:yes stop_codon:yes gene_type:complete
MAINKRTYPNDYFAWYNDDTRLAIVTQDTTNDSSERTSEKYDSFQGTGDLSGNITETAASSTVVITSASHGLIDNDRVTISGTTTYDGNRTITRVNDNSFSITDSNSGSDEGAVSGVTWTSLFINDGLRITYHAKYETVSALTDNLQTGSGVDSGLHPAIVCFVKSRLFEDQGDVERAMYFRKMYEKALKQYPSRRSGVRTLAVPHM